MEIEGIFYLESYSQSHKILTFEHSIHFEKKEVSKICFDAIFYLQIPDEIYNPKIYVGSIEDKNYVDSQMMGTDNIWEMSEVYIIESDDNKYYIGAGRLRIE